MKPDIVVRNTRFRDFPEILELSRQVYPASPPWTVEQLSSHLRIFPQGQFVAVEVESQRVVGMAASLIVLWDDYDIQTNWRDFTDRGMFTNHDPLYGRTLYAAEIMVLPSMQGKGVGTRIYKARQELVERMKLLRIRAGARLRHFYKHADEMSAEEYVTRVVNGDLVDPTLSFQLKRGFRVIGVVEGYLLHDPESLGYAAVIEWINHAAASSQLSSELLK